MTSPAPTPPRLDASTPWPLLAVENLHLHYIGSTSDRPVRVVDGISFALQERGTALGVVGESGSGKTSLATALMWTMPRRVARVDGHFRLDGRGLSGLVATPPSVQSVGRPRRARGAP